MHTPTAYVHPYYATHTPTALLTNLNLTISK